MAVLPDSLDDNQRRIRRNTAEDLHAPLLAVDEAMLFGGIARMPAPDLDAFGANGGHDRLLGAGLRRPALLVRGKPQIAAGDHDHSIGHSHILARVIAPLGGAS